ncbi:glutaminase [Maliponia aquimaris]|uniref:Glutaminase n=1 Tax=Maliponia aquimaris TaxID=1673631 RepID=A0A238KHP3_9RHOB|nr:glutaminase [Maliponia aquimaris]SMX42345.1 Thermolabile glutaminase [Maliponia aquimaris]
MDGLQARLETLVAEVRAAADWGIPANYIPELAAVDPAQVGVAICLADGTEVSAGDARVPFSIQSISKVFSLAAVLGRVGDDLWRRVGREPSGTAFDSIFLLEHEGGRPRNPFINAGALVTTDALLGNREPRQALTEVVGLLRAAAEDGEIHIDKAVAQSEKDTADRNMALLHYLKSHGNLFNAPDRVLGTYVHHCAIEMTCRQLARAGRMLALLPGAPRLVSPLRARRINALMMTCGQYDGSGNFAFRVGLPGKSGVGGGILMVAPGKASIAVWSPGLDDNGNSKVGTWLAERIAEHTGWSAFAPS